MSANGKRHQQSYSYPMEIYVGLMGYEEFTLKDVTKELKEIGKEITKVTKNQEETSQEISWLARSSQNFSRDYSTEDVLKIFKIVWNDFKDQNEEEQYGFNRRMIRSLCEAIFKRLSVEENPKLIEIRRLILKMARKDYFDRNEFMDLGDNVLRLINKS